MNFKTTISKLFVLTFLFTVVSVNTVVALDEKPVQETKKDNRVVLQVAVVANSPKTTLAFIATNNGDTDFRTSTLAGTWNRLVLVAPNGEETEIYDRIMEVEPTIIKPSESKKWEIEILPVLETVNLQSSGVYNLYWKLRDITTGDTTFKYESNRISLLLKAADK